MSAKFAEYKDAVCLYITARSLADEAEIALTEAARKRNRLHEEMQEAWCQCKGAPAGVYAFQEHGRTCVALTGGDYPALTRILE